MGVGYDDGDRFVRKVSVASMFSDISTHWASGCIVVLAQRKLLNGYPNGTFRPKASVSRAEFAALMPRVFPQLLAREQATAFRDVFDAYWARDAIAWVSERGLFGGYPDESFRPRLTMPRAQAIVVLMSGLEASQGVDATLAEPAGDALERVFSDAAQIPDYARGAISAALDRQLLDSFTEPRPFKPAEAITRGEVAALCCRVLEIPVESLAREMPALSAAADRLATFQRLLAQESGFEAEKLAFLDRGIARSPYRQAVAKTALRLQTPTGVPLRIKESAPYPETGTVFFVNEGGLDFLEGDVLSACVCQSTSQGGQLVTRWLGREALSERQLWSATKFIPLLNVATRANAFAPRVDIDDCWVRSAGSSGRGYRFSELAASIMNYDNRVATSNSLAVMFKRFESPERLEKWTRQATGNQELSFQGRYGEVPFIQQPELWSPKTKQVVLKAVGKPHSGQNLLSTYDLTRLLSMLGWHWQLPPAARIPHLQGHSVESLIRAMAVDTARYVDVAFDTLGLTPWIQNPVIISKSGFGRSDERDRTELTYCALVQFSLPRALNPQGRGQSAPDPTAIYQRYSLCFTLIAAQDVGDANKEARYVDALMAASVTEIIRRAVTETL